MYEYANDQDKATIQPESVADVPAFGESEEESDSDTELHNEMTRLLLDGGKKKLEAGNSRGAERLLLNSLQRVAAPGMAQGRSIAIQLEAIELL